MPAMSDQVCAAVEDERMADSRMTHDIVPVASSVVAPKLDADARTTSPLSSSHLSKRPSQKAGVDAIAPDSVPSNAPANRRANGQANDSSSDVHRLDIEDAQETISSGDAYQVSNSDDSHDDDDDDDEHDVDRDSDDSNGKTAARAVTAGRRNGPRRMAQDSARNNKRSHRASRRSEAEPSSASSDASDGSDSDTERPSKKKKTRGNSRAIGVNNQQRPRDDDDEYSDDGGSSDDDDDDADADTGGASDSTKRDRYARAEFHPAPVASAAEIRSDSRVYESIAFLIRFGNLLDDKATSHLFTISHIEGVLLLQTSPNMLMYILLRQLNGRRNVQPDTWGIHLRLAILNRPNLFPEVVNSESVLEAIRSKSLECVPWLMRVDVLYTLCMLQVDENALFTKAIRPTNKASAEKFKDTNTLLHPFEIAALPEEVEDDEEPKKPKKEKKEKKSQSGLTPSAAREAMCAEMLRDTCLGIDRAGRKYWLLMDCEGGVRVVRGQEKEVSDTLDVIATCVEDVKQLVAALEMQSAPYAKLNEEQLAPEFEVCKGCDNKGCDNALEKDHLMLLCEACHPGCIIAAHTFCLSPELESVPAGEWFCPQCVWYKQEILLLVELRETILKELEVQVTKRERAQRRTANREKAMERMLGSTWQDLEPRSSGRRTASRGKIDYTGAGFDAMINAGIARG
jgi:hypothetical protein